MHELEGADFAHADTIVWSAAENHGLQCVDLNLVLSPWTGWFLHVPTITTRVTSGATQCR